MMIEVEQIEAKMMTVVPDDKWRRWMRGGDGGEGQNGGGGDEDGGKMMTEVKVEEKKMTE